MTMRPEVGNVSFAFCLNESDNETAEPEHLAYEAFFENARFITGLVLYPTTCFIGFFGNVISIVVLSAKKMRNSTNTYLLTLAIADTIKIVTDFLYFIVVIKMRIKKEDGEYLMGVLYPYSHYLLHVSICASAWLTVSVAIERYILVCMPTRVKELCNIQRARTVCISVFSIVALITIPYFLRYTPTTLHIQCNETTTNKYVLNVTALWSEDGGFVTPYNWFHNCVRTLVPLIILIGLNSLILLGLRRTRVARRQPSATQRITLMLLMIVLIFVVCVTPDAILSTILNQGYTEAGNLTKGVREITDYLLLVNSAVNFIPYCVFNKQFRKHFLRIFCPRIYKLYSAKARSTQIDGEASMFTMKNTKSCRKSSPACAPASPLHRVDSPHGAASPKHHLTVS